MTIMTYLVANFSTLKINEVVKKNFAKYKNVKISHQRIPTMKISLMRDYGRTFNFGL